MMSVNTPAGLVAALAGQLQTALPEFEVIEGFANRQFYGSLKKPLLAVTIPGVKLIPAGCGDYLGLQAGESTGSEVYGRLAEVTAGFSFYLPASGGWENPSRYFLDLCGLLLDGQDEVAEIQCGEPEFLDGMQCFVLRAQAVLQMVIAEDEVWAPVREIVVRMKKEEETE